MKFNSLFLTSLLFGLSACVTEPKPDDKPYVATISSEEAHANLQTSKQGPQTGIMVTCEVLYAKNPKKHACGAVRVKITEDLQKKSHEIPLSGARFLVPLPPNTSYTLEIKTAGCSEIKTLSGLIAGMALSVRFDNCAGK